MWNENIPVFYSSFAFITEETRVDTREQGDYSRSFPKAEVNSPCLHDDRPDSDIFRASNPLHYILRTLILDHTISCIKKQQQSSAPQVICFRIFQINKFVRLNTVSYTAPIPSSFHSEVLCYNVGHITFPGPAK
jgi:hypothetical protein